MNSLYKNYIKNSLILMGGASLFSIFLNIMDIMSERASAVNGQEKWTSYMTEWSQWAGTIFIIIFAAIGLNTFLHYKDVNKKTGVFIKQLPVKYGNDFKQFHL